MAISRDITKDIDLSILDESELREYIFEFSNR